MRSSLSKSIVLFIVGLSLISQADEIAKPDAVNKDEANAKTIVENYFNQPVVERYGISGLVGVRGRYQESPSGVKTYSRLQDKIQLDGYVSLTEDGCLKARGQITTGRSYGGTWDETGIGADNVDASFDLHLRRLFLDISCYFEKIKLGSAQLKSVELGAMAPIGGGLGLKDEGWVDGVRAIIQVGTDKKIRVVVTAGEVDELITASVFERSSNGFNYTQIEVDGKISDRLSFVTDITEYDTNEYVRAALKVAVKDVLKVIDAVGVDAITANGEQYGLMISAEKQFANEWKAKVSSTDIRDANLNERTRVLPMEDFYGKGSNYQLVLERTFKKKWVLKIRFRNGEAGPRHEIYILRLF